MTQVIYKSKCCKAEVRMNGMPDFIGSKEACTVYYVCLKCNKPCDIVASKSQKRIEEIERRLNFQGKILQKLVKFFDGITIHPVKGVILTSEKKRQLAELNEMEQKHFQKK